jgi:putative transposase
MRYPSDLSDSHWKILEPLLDPPDKEGPKFEDLRTVVDAILYISHTGCQWRYLPSEYGKWTRVWSQFRRWKKKGTWDRVLAACHTQVRLADGREPEPSMIILDPSLARGASNGGKTFHDQGGPHGATKGAKQLVAVDITGLPLAAVTVPASIHDGKAISELLAAHDFGERLEQVLVDRGVNTKQAAAIANAKR